MNTSPTLRPVTTAELRAIIETAGNMLWEDVEHDRVVNRCDEISDRYSNLLFTQGIDYVELYKHEHSCLAVRTSDEGILYFDPTIRQFYPGYPHPYFLGTPNELLAYIHVHGGLDRNIEPNPEEPEPTTARNAYFGQEITHPMIGYVGYDPLTRARYEGEWQDSLRALEPIDDITPWMASIIHAAPANSYPHMNKTDTPAQSHVDTLHASAPAPRTR